MQARAFINLCLMGSVDVTAIEGFFHRFSLAMDKNLAPVDQNHPYAISLEVKMKFFFVRAKSLKDPNDGSSNASKER